MGFLSVWCLLGVVLVAEMTSATSPPRFLAGGLSGDKAPTPQVQNLVNSVRQEAEGRVNQRVTQFDLISYKTQVVAGINYFTKVAIGEGTVVELKIYEDLNGKVSLEDITYI